MKHIILGDNTKSEEHMVQCLGEPEAKAHKDILQNEETLLGCVWKEKEKLKIVYLIVDEEVELQSLLSTPLKDLITQKEVEIFETLGFKN